MKSTSAKLALCFVLGLGSAAGGARAGDLYVICNSGVSLQSGDMRDMFLGDKQFAGAVKLQPADNAAAQAGFLDKVMKMDAGKYSTSWTKKSFRDGLTMPPIKGTDAEAFEFVKRTAGACSYMTSTPGPGVTLVVKL
jgi:hypothetical protein